MSATKYNQGHVRDIARICHQANKAYCESIGDMSQVDWDDAPEWQHQSVIDGVNFRAENPEVTPEQMHDNWTKHKLGDGWKYGGIKDPETKTHPCLVPYRLLPPEQQSKDHIFKAIVEAMI